eukprot:scaffold13478_cov132-Cylindrotheca_fusiformis.AAC.11
MSSKITSDDTALERTIQFMSSSSGCFDSTHFHSFQSVSFHLPFRSCEGCGKRLQLFGKNPTSQVVQCKACGAFAHRSCGFSKDLKWRGPCPVNFQSIRDSDIEFDSSENEEPEKSPALFSFLEPSSGLSKERGLGEGASDDKNDDLADLSSPVQLSDDQIKTVGVQTEKGLRVSAGARDDENDDNTDSSGPLQLSDDQINNQASIFRDPLRNEKPKMPENRPVLKSAASEDGIVHGRRYTGKANFPFLSATNLLPSFKQQELESGQQNCNNSLIRKSCSWVEYGTGYREFCRSKFQAGTTELKAQNSEDRVENELDASFEWTKDGPPLHWANPEMVKSLPSKVECGDGREEPDESPVYFASHTFSNVSRALHENITAHFQPVVDRYLVKGRDGHRETEADLQEDVGTPKNSGSIQHRKISRTFSVESETPSEAEVEGLLEEKLDKESSSKRLGLATVAGGVAGGIAGLMFAGPVGWVIGGKMGQTAGILGVVLEGSVGIGVFASGIAAGRHAGQQIQDKIEENRILALGDGTRQRVLLVRPNVTVDPEWADLYTRIRKSHTSDIYFNIFPSGIKAAKRERYEREFDIVKTDEMELATEDKVLLLVSRQLNNRESLPGHVYRELLKIVRERSDVRGPICTIFEESSKPVQESSIIDEDLDSQTPMVDDAAHLRRSRRQDAHAVIKYVTATLLEVRPGFSVSPAITELTATAVESLVFGEVYDLIIEEIEAAYKSEDESLLAKIADFERREEILEEKVHQRPLVSESAISALHRLPEAHSVADKLRYCTVFLERISDFFSEPSEDGKKSTTSIGADSLLKMVCQHLLLAKVPTINAQVAFIEEFARDEQLLRGKEGYSLVTLQASLHFLNRSEDLAADIFEQEDDF